MHETNRFVDSLKALGKATGTFLRVVGATVYHGVRWTVIRIHMGLLVIKIQFRYRRLGVAVYERLVRGETVTTSEMTEYVGDVLRVQDNLKSAREALRGPRTEE